tara:strand:- start:1496 stop:2011 length:516 start_codon:yes stop_codon:yes gene_type:complete
MSFHIISALESGKGIGKNCTLPWKLKSDLIHFSKTTKGNGNNTVIMGKNTWHSIGSKCLPNRINIVLSKTLHKNDSSGPDYIFSNISELINFCKQSTYDAHWVIGGEQIYKSFLELDICETCVLTILEANFECDTFFPIDLCREKMDIITVNNFDTKTEIRAQIHILQKKN